MLLLPFLIPSFVLVAYAGTPRQRETRTLSSKSLKKVKQMDPQPWKSVSQGHLGELLVTRVAGSENNKKVREYIKSVFKRLGWHIEEDTFTGATPIGDLSFTNLIFTFDIDAPMKLMLSAHHDSKWFPNAPDNQFIGATDSAAPCATLIDVAEFITPLLRARQKRIADGLADDNWDEEEAAETTLQIVLFDGEEAFENWTDEDSTYGSRHLAQVWETSYLPYTHALYSRRMSPNPTQLTTIEHMVLLDLLGAPNPRIISGYTETEWLHDMMMDVDSRLKEQNLVETMGIGVDWFQKSSWGGRVEDDQLPFIHRGVSVLHVISNPFPSVWHTIRDNADALDLPTLHRWNLIMRVFALEYLGLSLDGSYEERSEGGAGTHAHDELVSDRHVVSMCNDTLALTAPHLQ